MKTKPNPYKIELDDARRLALLQPPAVAATDAPPVRIVLDTDTDNEIDDQFAVAYAILSPERLDLLAIYAAPFASSKGDDRAPTPAIGMRRSYDELLKMLDLLGADDVAKNRAFRGSEQWLKSPDQPRTSDAVEHLIELARAGADNSEPLYVVAVGAITNIANALLLAPDIAQNIVVVWLGGNPHYWHRAVEYNVYQDMTAARVLFDSGVALVHVPCVNVSEHLRLSRAEVDTFVAGRGDAGDYLARIFADYTRHSPHATRVIWDIAPLAWLVRPDWCPSAIIHSPILTDEGTWSHNPFRPTIREMMTVNRDAIFTDFFTKMETLKGGTRTYAK